MAEQLQKFHSFSKGERNAIVVLLLLCGIVIVLPKLYLHFRPPAKIDYAVYEKEIQTFLKEYEEKKSAAPFFYRQDSTRRNTYSSKAKTAITYFDFDPNTIGVEEWVKLGFSERQALSIEKYKASGGRFYKPEDLKRVYVIGEENYDRLAPYIKIARKEYVKNESMQRAKSDWTIDINTADSAQFEKLRGIGPSYARRMVSYRNALGGYYSPEQIKEVWGLPDSTFQAIRGHLEVTSPLNKTNINSVSLQRLEKHPYIRYYLAQAIEKYRDKVGKLSSLEELKNVKGMNDSLYQRIIPYFMVE